VGYSPWGHQESDTTERLHFLFTLSTQTLKPDTPSWNPAPPSPLCHWVSSLGLIFVIRKIRIITRPILQGHRTVSAAAAAKSLQSCPTLCDPMTVSGSE